MITPDNYYMGEGAALEQVGLQIGLHTYPLGQFDLALNRPDIVLARLGKTSKETNALFEQSYLRRLERLGISPSSVNTAAELPTLELIKPPPFAAVGSVELQAPTESKEQAQVGARPPPASGPPRPPRPPRPRRRSRGGETRPAPRAPPPLHS